MFTFSVHKVFKLYRNVKFDVASLEAELEAGSMLERLEDETSYPLTIVNLKVFCTKLTDDQAHRFNLWFAQLSPWATESKELAC